jgi:hypothetical protein
VSRRYSDQLPSFKGDEDEESKDKRDYERFAPWVRDGFAHSGRREPRPFVQMAAFLVMILCLGYGLSRPLALKDALVGEDHPRIALPIQVVGGEPPPWNEHTVRAAIDQVRPASAACLQGWSELVTNQEGAVIAEVVLGPEGPDEAALYDQVTAVPTGIGDCLAEALGSVSWPLPKTQQSVTFPIVGGS